jgi:hypothetical protein
MNLLAKTVFTGKWKSFKLFKQKGDIRFNNEHHYKEFEFAPDGFLTIKRYKGSAIEKISHTNQWSLELKDKKHFLRMPMQQQLYEVITVNHTVLVLLDIATTDKIFLAREAHWNAFLKSNTQFPL